MSVSRVLFITEAVASIMGESISNTVDCSQLINDIEIEFWEKLISAGLMTVELMNNDKVFQVFVISEHDYRVSSAMNLEMPHFKCFDNN